MSHHKLLQWHDFIEVLKRDYKDHIPELKDMNIFYLSLKELYESLYKRAYLTIPMSFCIQNTGHWIIFEVTRTLERYFNDEKILGERIKFYMSNPVEKDTLRFIEIERWGVELKEIDDNADTNDA